MQLVPLDHFENTTSSKQSVASRAHSTAVNLGTVGLRDG